MAPTAMLAASILALNTDPTITILYPAELAEFARTDVLVMNTPAYTDHVEILSNHTIGEYVNATSIIKDKDINIIEFILSKSSASVDGQLDVGIFNETTGVPKAIFQSYEGVDFGKAPQIVVSQLAAGSYTLVEGDIVGVRYISGGAGSVFIGVTTVDFDGDNTILVDNDAGSSSFTSGSDASLILINTITTGILPVTYTIEPNAMIILNGMSVAVGGMLIFTTFRRATMKMNVEK